MPDLLTTEEAATYLRLSERKLYELVAKNAVPCTKVTGRWLFPRAALDRWVIAGLITPTALAHLAAPPIVGGNIDGFTRTMTTAIVLETSKGTCRSPSASAWCSSRS